MVSERMKRRVIHLDPRRRARFLGPPRRDVHDARLSAEQLALDQLIHYHCWSLDAADAGPLNRGGVHGADADRNSTTGVQNDDVKTAKVLSYGIGNDGVAVR